MLFLFTFVSQALFAQRPREDRWDVMKEGVGPKEKPVYFSAYAEGGLSLSSYHSTDSALDPGLSSLTGFSIGAGINMRFLKRDESTSVDFGLLGVQTGLMYSTSGFKSGDVKIKGNYLCIPLEIQYYPLTWLYVGLGPEVYINLSSSPDNPSMGGMNMNLSDHKSNDVKFGLGAGFIMKSLPIGCSIKYLIGTSKFAENLPWKGNIFRISVFYRFGL